MTTYWMCVTLQGSDSVFALQTLREEHPLILPETRFTIRFISRKLSSLGVFSLHLFRLPHQGYLFQSHWLQAAS